MGHSGTFNCLSGYKMSSSVPNFLLGFLFYFVASLIKDFFFMVWALGVSLSPACKTTFLSSFESSDYTIGI